MTRLVRVELTRFRSRLLLWLVAGGLVLVAGGLVALAWEESEPPSPAALEQQRQYYEQAVADWAEHGDEYVADCRTTQAEVRGRQGDPAIDFGCDSLEPTWAAYRWQPTFVELAPTYLETLVAPLVLAALIMGVSFVAAEISTGALGTWLTFVPRRTPVYLSKLAAAALGVVPPAVLALGTVLVGSWLAYAGHDALGGTTSATWASLLQMCGRMLAAVVLLAAVGVATGALTRHTAAGIGVLAVVAIVDQMLTSTRPALTPWSPQFALHAWVAGGADYGLNVCAPGDDGVVQCDWVTHQVSQAHAGVVLVVVTVAVTAAAVLVFRRRDVA